MNRYEYLTGRVKWFNRQRGYGMIAPDNRSPQVFFHHSVITGNGPNILFEGDLVEYILDFGRTDFPEASEVWRRQPVAPKKAQPRVEPQRAVQQPRQPVRQSTLGSQRQRVPAAAATAARSQIMETQVSPAAGFQAQPVQGGRRLDPITAQKVKQLGTSEHVTGTVLSFNRLKGFGFIEPHDGESPAGLCPLLSVTR